LTPTATPDLQGPAITNLQATPNPISPTLNCRVTLSADISDPAGVTGALVNWTFTNAQQLTENGSLNMTPAQGNTWQAAWTLSFRSAPPHGTITWSVVANDGLRNPAIANAPPMTVEAPGCP
jgi:hypothetical protein